MFTNGDIDEVIQWSVESDGDLSFPEGNLAPHVELVPEIVECAVGAGILPSDLRVVQEAHTRAVIFMFRVPGTSLDLATRVMFDGTRDLAKMRGRDAILAVLIEAYKAQRMMMRTYEEAANR